MYKDTIYTLKKPIDVETNGNKVETIKQLTLAWDSLTASDLRTANKICAMLEESNAGSFDNSTVSQRLNSNLRIAIAWTAAMRGTSNLKINDVFLLSMVDALCLAEDALSEYLFR